MVKRIVSESLVVVYPESSWCYNPAVVNRLQKTSSEIPTAGQTQFRDFDLQLLVEEQDVVAEHVTYSATEPEAVVDEEAIEIPQEGNHDVPLQDEPGYMPLPHPLVQEGEASTQPPSPATTDLFPSEPEGLFDLGASLGTSPAPPPMWREPCDNLLSPAQEEERGQIPPPEHVDIVVGDGDAVIAQ